MGKQYTFDEAIDTVLELKERFSTMPTKEDYEKVSKTVDLAGLARALGVRGGSYAAINIAVLRELRKREGRNEYIS